MRFFFCIFSFGMLFHAQRFHSFSPSFSFRSLWTLQYISSAISFSLKVSSSKVFECKWFIYWIFGDWIHLISSYTVCNAINWQTNVFYTQIVIEYIHSNQSVGVVFFSCHFTLDSRLYLFVVLFILHMSHAIKIEFNRFSIQI